VSPADAVSSASPDRSAELDSALARVEARLTSACRDAGRDRSEVTLVAVSKTWPAADVAALAAGPGALRHFGEARDQEAAPKVEALAASGWSELVWHFVGRLQRNKARSVARYASVVHSVDRPELAEALGEGARRAGRALDSLVQVSLDGDPSRGGAVLSDVPALADAVASCEGLRLRGLMAVVPLGAAPEPAFDRLASCADRLRERHPQARWISAGMSTDMEAAVARGATHVRVGSALFGGRARLPG
jgi:PLP dependent protein